MGEEDHSIGNARMACRWYIAFVISVMLQGWSNVKTMGTMGVPGFPFIRLVVDYDFTPRRSHGGFIVVKAPMDLVVCAEFWVVS